MHLPFKTLLYVALVTLAGASVVRADDTLRKAQQALRDQGFYYGTVDGSPGDETTQALRRYQIRNGLAVTGQLNDETQKSLARTGGASAPARPRPSPSKTDEDRRYANGGGAPQPPVPPPLEPPPPVIDGNSGDEADAPAPPRRPASRPDLRVAPEPDRAPAPEREEVAPGGFRPSASLTNLLEGTPFEFAPPPVQSDVLRRAQITLLRSGFYGGEPDGVPGGQTTDALSEFQSANRLRRTGRLDVETLGALRLLPGRLAPPRRGYPPVFEGRIVR